MNRRIVISFLLFSILLVPTSFTSQNNVKCATENVSIENPRLDDPLPEKEWTFMVYLDGDNNLEAAAIDDINEMEAAGGSTADVNIIVLVDLCEYDSSADNEYGVTWNDARYYYIESGTDPDVIESTIISEEGEINMGDPDTLTSFIDFVTTNYPAKHYALSLWDHGGGLEGICWDETSNNANIGIQEMQVALDGYHFDFLGLDACIMGQYEILYEISPFADYIGLSLLNEPGDGWDYENSLPYLLADPYIAGDVLGEHICQTYVDQYSSAVTFTIWNTTDMTNVQNEMEELALVLIDNVDTYAEDIGDAREAVWSREYPNYEADLYEFIVNLQTGSSIDIINQAADTQAALEEINVMTYSTFTVDPFGLWIYFPMVPNEEYNQYYANSASQYVNNIPNPYYGLDFVMNSSWEEFIYLWRDYLPAALETLYDNDIVPVTTPGGGDYYSFDSVLGDQITVDVEVIDFEGEGGIDLYDSQGRLVDSDYSSNNPLHVEYTCEKNGSAYLGVFPEGYQATFSYEITVDIDSRPYIKELYTVPNSPGFGEDIEFVAEILDGHGLDEVILSYSISGTWTDMSMTQIGLGLYNAFLPVDETVEQILYKVTATDSLANTKASSTKTLIFHESDAPVLVDVSLNPRKPKSGEEVEFTITVTDETGIDKVIVSCLFDGVWDNETVYDDDLEEYTFTFMVPENLTEFSYTIYVYDTWGNVDVTDGTIVALDEAPFSTSTVFVTISFVALVYWFFKSKKQNK